MAIRVLECAFWATVLSVGIAMIGFAIRFAFFCVSRRMFRRMFPDDPPVRELSPDEIERWKHAVEEDWMVKVLVSQYILLSFPAIVLQHVILRRDSAMETWAAFAMNLFAWFVILFIGTFARASLLMVMEPLQSRSIDETMRRTAVLGYQWN